MPRSSSRSKWRRTRLRSDGESGRRGSVTFPSLQSLETVASPAPPPQQSAPWSVRCRARRQFLRRVSAMSPVRSAALVEASVPCQAPKRCGYNPLLALQRNGTHADSIASGRRGSMSRSPHRVRANRWLQKTSAIVSGLLFTMKIPTVTCGAAISKSGSMGGRGGGHK
jgi:hypothetical protein